jgi:hypothetical protein
MNPRDNKEPKVVPYHKFGVQASHNGGALMFAKIRLKTTHSIILDEIEWLFIFFASTHKMFQSPTFTSSKVNNIDVITLNIVNLDLPWLCDLRHG